MSFKRNSARILLAVAAGALAQTGAVAQTTPQTQVPGQFKVGMEISYPPFESYEGDQVVGSDPELARLLARQLGASASFVDTRFSGLILGLNSGHYDAVISGMYVTPERVAQARVIPYAQTGAAILVLASGQLKPQVPEALCGLSVGVEQGASWAPTLRSVSQNYCKAHGKSEISVSEFPSAPEAMQALLSHNVQAQMEIAGAARALAAKSSGRVVVTSTQLIYPQTLGIYVKKDNSSLFDALSKALDKLQNSGEYGVILKKYDLVPPAKSS
ncbi:MULTISPECIES: transporter substrate-binding domain-containing protein [Paraburkholderia]|uniref:transporter substrate-binding domain-containing protein n=1 Tax=Paraburkholderia TaxID=1822464 RepID=UPI001B03C305|nr:MULTISPECIES: transporter substrate-binding domain-containing protein [Paraburkholderia]MCX4138078.1 transporter substrate-binding domain-containing protein [Paraburkholderia aspalathi]MCX4155898.1 transporter substrate-binding domain-containing protein [Paraburkholderia aspalathi]MDN7165305.1 transporter substrate-binding domain-containing protein [Paraburkholderia sp. SECH2]MDN7170769.1 transporter substrate-binding domain-containing protein [Paraburkholderia sp. SEWSISQ10-3 4]MDQ6393791.